LNFGKQLKFNVQPSFLNVALFRGEEGADQSQCFNQEELKNPVYNLAKGFQGAETKKRVIWEKKQLKLQMKAK